MLSAALTHSTGEGFIWAAVFVALSLYTLLAVVCLGSVIREAWFSRDIRLGRLWPVLIRMTTPKWTLLRPWVWFLTAVPGLLEALQTQAWRQEARSAEEG
ncbi:hypothetical protein E7T06_13060 [Deinococcus sp. Arct2-2]|uniref:hypothetical protein n=1 Tax=Deinococcus sp. Arct2-2 TaxID=2568653 RepID=UPI0010A30802|nr:hypothetical protein [Deinococcus sp. Arct2-2]THF69199.1 hypothetical protein E7T06_13060 [Deinococcus sp. Arct2-2]